MTILLAWLAAGRAAPATHHDARLAVEEQLTLRSAASTASAETVSGPILRMEASRPGETAEQGERAIPFLEGRLCPLEQQFFADAADRHLDHHSLPQAALIASGVKNTEALRRYEKKLAALVERIRESVEKIERPGARAEAVFEFMHQRVLHKGYRVDCTDLRVALDQGRFNCVSASVLFNYLAGEIGLDVCGLEFPGHAMSRVMLPDGPLDLETTCPRWFRLRNAPKRRAELIEKALGRQACRNRSQLREVGPIEMAAMIYYNRGVDLLGEKQFERAAVANAKALRLDPSSSTARGNLLATINNWSIALGSEGDFPEAVELLQEGLAFDPAYETFALNYVHVHHQWVEGLCAAKRFEEALQVLDRGAAELPGRTYFSQAPGEVCRCWARQLFERDCTDEALAVFARARKCCGNSGELLAAEVAAINDRGLALLQQDRFQDAVQLYERGLAVHSESSLLRNNRRVAVMRWAQPAFERGDYAEAIRRTTRGARPKGLHPSLVNNLRYGYHRWIAVLTAAGKRKAADLVARQARMDPFLQGE